MTKPTVILLVMLLCLWASGSMATSSPVFYFGFPTQVSISSGAFFWLTFPPTPVVPAFVNGPFCTMPNGAPAEPEEPEEPDPEPLPIRPDLQGDLSGEGGDPPPPP